MGGNSDRPCQGGVDGSMNGVDNVSFRRPCQGGVDGSMNGADNVSFRRFFGGLGAEVRNDWTEEVSNRTEEGSDWTEGWSDRIEEGSD